MIEQQELDRINANASFFEAFFKDHPLIIAIVAPILLSWVVTAAVKGWVRPWILPARQNLTIRSIDCAIAVAAAAKMWPLEHAFVFALLIGCLSPFAYGLFSFGLCWKWPSMKSWLTLRELEPDLPAPVPPASDHEQLNEDPK